MKHFCLPSVWQGVRKISALLVFMLFTFVFVVSPIKVKAEAFPIPPVWLPMNPYNAQGLEGNYVLLNDDQKEIVKEIIGAVNVVNLGFGQYVLMNPIPGVQNTRQFLRDYGGTFLETFWTQIMGTSRAMTDFVGSTIYKASTYDTLEEYESDTAPNVASGSQKYFQISPELTVAFKNWYRANGGVEDWQLQSKPFNNLPFITQSMSESLLAQYETSLNTLTAPYVRLYSTYQVNFHDFRTSSIGPYNLFYNTSTGKVYLTDNYGNKIVGNQGTYKLVGCAGSSIFTYGSSRLWFNEKTYPTNMTFVDLTNYYFTQTGSTALINLSIYSNDVACIPIMNDIVNHVYVGADWSSKHEIFNIDDLNIGSTSSEYIDNIPDTGYVDINTLIGQIADEVINLREVVEESVLVKDDSQAIPYADSLKVAIDKYINQPESGVVIPVNIFGELTGVNGPVSYLWYMTKPLVSYTGDLLGLLTLDGDGTFQFTGLGYIVIGVVTVGIIGGLVTKCLL